MSSMTNPTISSKATVIFKSKILKIKKIPETMIFTTTKSKIPNPLKNKLMLNNKSHTTQKYSLLLPNKVISSKKLMKNLN